MGGKSQTAGYRYWLGIHMILCHSGVDNLDRITIDDRVVFSAFTNDIRYDEEDEIVNDDLTHEVFEKHGDDLPPRASDPVAAGGGGVVAPQVFGGDDGQGGVFGQYDLMTGEADQMPNAYLAQQHGEDNNPAYRGVLGFVWKQGYIGNNPYLKGWKFMIRAVTKDSRGDPIWYSEKAVIREWDLNPAHIIYMCLTNGDWGLGIPATEIDDANFRSAADRLFDENFGLSFLINTEAPVKDFISEVLQHLDAALITNRQTGLLQLKLIRDDYIVGNLPFFGPGNIRRITNYQRTQLSDLVNTVTIKYWDRVLGETGTYKIQDLAGIHVQGSVVERTQEYAGCCRVDTAAMLAARDLRALSVPMIAMDVEIDRSGSQLNVGDPIRISWPQHGLADVVFRIIKITEGELKSGALTLTVAQDVFGVNEAIYITPRPQLPNHGMFPVPADHIHIDDAPWILLYMLAPQQVAQMKYGDSAIFALAVSDQSAAYGYKLFIDTTPSDGPDPNDPYVEPKGPFDLDIYQAESDVVPFVEKYRTTDWAIDPDDTRAPMPDAGNSWDPVPEDPLEDDNESHFWSGLWMVGNELISIYKLDIIVPEGTTWRYYMYRGRYDTFPMHHPAGTPMFKVNFDSPPAVVPKVYAMGEPNLKAKVLPVTPMGALDPDKLGGEQVELYSRATLPYCHAFLRWGDPAQLPHLHYSLCHDWPENPRVMDDAGSFTLIWSRRDKVYQAENSAVPWDPEVDIVNPDITTEIRIYDELAIQANPNNKVAALLSTHSNLTGNTLVVDPQVYFVRIEMEAVEDGVHSRTFVGHIIRTAHQPGSGGYGQDYGNNYGG